MRISRFFYLSGPLVAFSICTTPGYAMQKFKEFKKISQITKKNLPMFLDNKKIKNKEILANNNKKLLKRASFSQKVYFSVSSKIRKASFFKINYSSVPDIFKKENLSKDPYFASIQTASLQLFDSENTQSDGITKLLGQYNLDNRSLYWGYIEHLWSEEGRGEDTNLRILLYRMIMSDEKYFHLEDHINLVKEILDALLNKVKSESDVHQKILKSENMVLNIEKFTNHLNELSKDRNKNLLLDLLDTKLNKIRAEGLLQSYKEWLGEIKNDNVGKNVIQKKYRKIEDLKIHYKLS